MAGRGEVRGWSKASAALLLALGLALLAVAIVTPLELKSQAAVAGAVVAASLLLNRRPGRVASLALVALSCAVSARYLWWRTTATLSSDGTLAADIGTALLFAAEVYAFVMLLLGYLPSIAPLARQPVPLPADPARWPTVDLFIPTYNEPLEVVRSTVLAAQAIDWPADKLRIYLLDDGRRSAFRAFAAEVGVGYLTRSDNVHAKAGNLNRALARTSGELIAIFDCDHIPTRGFLQLTVGAFLAEARLALVQTPHHFYSPDPFEKNLGTFGKVPNEGELFYGLIQRGYDTFDAAFFCGSCAVLRRSALEQVGGIATETVTEDAHTALKLHRRGFGSAYLDIPLAAGLATESLAAHVGQRIRWARGMAQIFRVDNPLLGRGLSVWQRLSYLASMLHFFSAIPRLIFLLAPLSYLLFGLHIFGALPVLAAAYALPHLVHAKLTAPRLQGSFRFSFWSEVYETCLCWYTALPTLLALINPRLGKFNVTAKGGQIDEGYFELRIARPYLALGALNLAGLLVGLYRLAISETELDVAAINLLWTGYNLVILAGVLAVAWESRQRRRFPRVAAALPSMLRLAGGQTLRCRTLDLSKGGARLALPSASALPAGAQLWLSVFAASEEVPLPAEVVGQQGDRVRVRFVGLGLEEERQLVQVLFSRANAWIHWRDGRAVDRPLAALQEVAHHGIVGLARFARLARSPRAAALLRLPAIARSSGP